MNRTDESGDGSAANPVISNQDVAVELGSRESRTNVPLSVQSIITQTDRSGQQIRTSDPVYDSDGEETAPKKPFMQRICSCFGRSKSEETKKSDSKNRQQGEDSKPPPPSVSATQQTAESTETPPYGQQGNNTIPMSARGKPAKTPDIRSQSTTYAGKKCLALDLDETLVHSSFQPVAQAHYKIPVTIDGQVHTVYVIKRPGVDEFMRRVGQHYEVVIYTASLSKYADPLLDKLDIHKVISNRLFREHCVFYDGHYVKDLSLLNRDIKQTIIVDNSTMSYVFHPENAIDCGSFIDDPSDVEMWQIADFLVGISQCEDVREHCRSWREWVPRDEVSVK